MTIMPKKINWDRVLDRSWFYTKIFFGILILCVIAFSYGTFKPNSIAVKNVTNKTEQFYLQKINHRLHPLILTVSNDIYIHLLMGKS